MTMFPGFVGSFLGFFLVKPVCYLRENATGWILRACIPMKPFPTDFITGVGLV